MKRSLIWFRNDLRLHDNEALTKASQAEEILPVYIIDPRLFETTAFGFAKTGAHRAKFLLESLENLRANLQNHHLDLVIRTGKPEEILPGLIENYDIDLTFTHKEITREEIDVEDKIKASAGDTLSFVWGSTLFHINDIPFTKTEIPDVFTQFRKKTEKESEVRKEYAFRKEVKLIPGVKTDALPSLNDLGLEEKEPDDRSVLNFKGGEDKALERLDEYFWKHDQLKNYKYTRNGLLGANYSSKFSP